MLRGSAFPFPAGAPQLPAVQTCCSCRSWDPPPCLYLLNTPRATCPLLTGHPRGILSLFYCSFQEGKYLQAVIQYGKIVSWLEMEYGLSEKESKASDSFLLAAFLNLAMCYLKLREYAKAVECCDKVGGPCCHPWLTTN